METATNLQKTLVSSREETGLPDRNTLEVFYLPTETRVNAVTFLRESHDRGYSTPHRLLPIEFGVSQKLGKD